MRLKFFDQSTEDRHLAFEQAALRRGLSPVIIEKDFWVCWMLGVLFESKFGNHLVFKGGTSLSKVFGVIARFSEDIDLSLSPEFLELSIPAPTQKLSRNQANKWMTAAEAACAQAIENQIFPELEQAIVAILGERNHRWLEYQTDTSTNSPILLFHYPTTQATGFEYIRPAVKLEFGSLTDQRPVGRHPVRPWLTDAFPQALADWQCEVVALELERSFWEKATILHAEHHRPADKPMPDRFSRHYADTAALAKHEITAQALGDHALRDRVVNWKSQFFGSKWASYDRAKPGSFRLAPPAESL